MKNENEDSPRKEINTTKHFWLIFFFQPGETLHNHAVPC